MWAPAGERLIRARTKIASERTVGKRGWVRRWVWEGVMVGVWAV
jgi:hypothetical protein